MPVREKTFSPRKAVESMLYIAERLKSPTIHEVLKIRYFADKRHLERYGFVASGDGYCAMNFGPVASSTYDLLKVARGEHNRWFSDADAEIVHGALVVDHDVVSVRRLADTRYLSPADIRCLDEAIAQFGNLPFGERTSASHDSAWTKARTEHQGAKAPAMAVEDIALAATDDPDLIEHLRS